MLRLRQMRAENLAYVHSNVHKPFSFERHLVR